MKRLTTKEVIVRFLKEIIRRIESSVLRDTDGFLGNRVLTRNVVATANLVGVRKKCLLSLVTFFLKSSA